MESSPWVERIIAVADYVQAHLDHELTPEQLAQVAGFSLHHFHRVFRGMTGESVMGFVRRLRLERAAQRLKFGDDSVTRVAFASGYGSHEAFTRAFRARFGVAPRTFRDREQRALDTSHPFSLREEPERVCLALRRVGSYTECEQAWGRLYGWAATAGLGAYLQVGVGLCYDDPEVTDASRLRYDACIVVPDEVASRVRLPPGVTVRRIPGGRYAVALHIGSYHSISETYVALLGRWLPRRGFELADEPVLEIYLDLPTQTAPDELRTEVCVRIA